jgi:hypothetical protein
MARFCGDVGEVGEVGAAKSWTRVSVGDDAMVPALIARASGAEGCSGVMAQDFS